MMDLKTKSDLMNGYPANYGSLLELVRDSRKQISVLDYQISLLTKDKGLVPEPSPWDEVGRVKQMGSYERNVRILMDQQSAIYKKANAEIDRLTSFGTPDGDYMMRKQARGDLYTQQELVMDQDRSLETTIHLDTTQDGMLRDIEESKSQPKAEGPSQLATDNPEPRPNLYSLRLRFNQVSKETVGPDNTPQP